MLYQLAGTPYIAFIVLPLVPQCNAQVQSPGRCQKLPEDCRGALGLAALESHALPVQGVVNFADGDGDEVHGPIRERKRP